MNWAVGEATRIGDHAFAVITQTQISMRTVGSVVVGHGEKRPVLILCSDGDIVRGIALDGHIWSADDIARRYPHAIEKTRAMLAEV